jgi:hypothetical protein
VRRSIRISRLRLMRAHDIYSDGFFLVPLARFFFNLSSFFDPCRVHHISKFISAHLCARFLALVSRFVLRACLR